MNGSPARRLAPITLCAQTRANPSPNRAAMRDRYCRPSPARGEGEILGCTAINRCVNIVLLKVGNCLLPAFYCSAIRFCGPAVLMFSGAEGGGAALGPRCKPDRSRYGHDDQRQYDEHAVRCDHDGLALHEISERVQGLAG